MRADQVESPLVVESAIARRPSVAFFMSDVEHGGMQKSLIGLASALVAAGHEVCLVLQEARGEMISLVPPSIEIVDLRKSSNQRSLVPFARFLDQWRPAVVITGSPHVSLIAIAAAHLANHTAAVIVTEHAPLRPLVSRHGGWRYRLLPLLVRLVYPYASAIVAVSEGVAVDFRCLVPAARRIELIHNPVVAANFEELASRPVSDFWCAANDPPLLIAVGRLAPEKNYPNLLAAFAALLKRRPVRLAIVGDGPEQIGRAHV